MTPIALEDTFADVVSKAARGLVLTDKCIADRSGTDPDKVAALRAGHWDEGIARGIAPVLGLDTEGLLELAAGRSCPPPLNLANLEAFHTPYGDMIVNSYLVWDALSRSAVAFDTGADSSELLDFLHQHDLKLVGLFLTHTHGDHIFDLDRICERTHSPAFVNELEPLSGAESFVAGRVWDYGWLRIESRLTRGHSRGGTTYFLAGLERPVAIVGDALFCGSMGGGMVSYADAIKTNRSEIFTLPPQTVICPGHGPMTTVEWESAHNPFFGPASRSGNP
jgi:hydroxyacylglutathione hydrolase